MSLLALGPQKGGAGPAEVKCQLGGQGLVREPANAISAEESCQGEFLTSGGVRPGTPHFIPSASRVPAGGKMGIEMSIPCLFESDLA